MKTKVVQHAPRITHVTHVTLTGAQLLFPFEHFDRNFFISFEFKTLEVTLKDQAIPLEITLKIH